MLRPDAGGGSPRAAASEGAPAPRTKVALTLGFVLAGVVVVLYAARTDPIFDIPLSAQFGLLQLLPPLYWFGMGLLALSLALAARGDSDLLFVLAGAALLGVFTLTPVLFEPNPPVWDAYLHFASAEGIVRTGRLPTDPSQYAANWPGFFLVVAFADLIGGLAPVQIISLFPLFSSIFTFVALFVFLRSFFSPSIARPASILSGVLNVWAQPWLSPQGIGLALALLVLATAWDRRVPVRMANACLFVALVLSHATSTLFLLGILGMDALFVQLTPRRRPTRASRATLFGTGSNPFLAYAATWLGWLFFVASGSALVAQTAVATQIGKILQLGEAPAHV